jgi:hypothetical protein
MALTNIELYEVLKKDLSEESARMIAEVVPAAGDLATKVDLLDVEKRLVDRIASLERRFFAIFAVPLWGAVVAAVVKYVVG